jgi:predicted amidophosphoribosyltransferase
MNQIESSKVRGMVRCPTCGIYYKPDQCRICGRLIFGETCGYCGAAIERCCPNCKAPAETEKPISLEE